MVLLVLSFWALWFFASSLTVRVTSTSARLVSGTGPYTVEASISGLVEEVLATLGAPIAAGAALVRLDPDHAAIDLEEAKTVTKQLEAEQSQLEARRLRERQAVDATLHAHRAAVEVARQELREAEIARRLAELHASRWQELFDEGLSSRAELDTALGELERQKTFEQAKRTAVEQLQWELDAEQDRQAATLAELDGRIARLQGESESSRAEVERSREEHAQTTLRAPISGRVATLHDLQRGATVQPGQPVATIVSDEALRVVAEFEPDRALGRIQPGQRCQLRLDAYPWTQFGTAEGSVQRVALEPRGGSVRVEAVLDSVPSGIELQHGLTGRLEVELEDASPAVVTLRFLAR